MITKNEAYWERIARIKEEMLSVSYKENEALKATLAMINPQQSPWREYWESLLKENEELRTQVTTQRTWVGLTIEDKKEYISQDFGGNRLDAMAWAEKRLKEKNNGT